MKIGELIKERYFIKVVPLRGEIVHRFEVTRQHIVSALVAVAVILAGSFGIAGLQIYRAHDQVARLQTLTSKQLQQLQTIDKQTAKIRSQLQRVQRQNQQIQQLIGAKPTKTSARPSTRHVASRNGLMNLVSRHVEMLSVATDETAQESNALRRLTMHVLNVRHLQELSRARMLAAIPSIDPVDGAAIVGCFCYRTYPDTEFHPGVDLAADYGETVHAAAAGTIASAGWDGGYGLKVEVDHGNGYHTWYAHLSHIDVSVGQSVYKGQAIALVGSTGFSTGPHLHYQVMLNGSPVDPTPYLSGVPPKVLAALP